MPGDRLEKWLLNILSRENKMKKSIKVLVLGVLTSLVMFAVVYAKPMVAQAGSYSDSGTEAVDRWESFEYWDEDEGEYDTGWRELDSYDGH